MKKDNPNLNKIDTLFKESLKNRNFAFKEEYWDEAENMISQYEQSGRIKYKKQSFVLWRNTAFLLLLLFGLLIFRPDNEQPLQTESNPSKIETDIQHTYVQENISQIEIDTTRGKYVPAGTVEAQPETDNLIGLRSDGKENKGAKSNRDTPFYALQEKHTKALNSIDNIPHEELFTGQNTNALTNELHTVNAVTKQQNGGDASGFVHDGITGEAIPENQPAEAMAETSKLLTIVAADSAVISQKEDIESTGFLQERAIQFYVGAHFGYDYVTKTFSSANPAYDTEMERQETALLTNSYGLQIGIDLKNFNIATGFDFYKHGEKLNYSDAYISYDTIFAEEISEITVLDSIITGYDTTYLSIDSMEIDEITPIYDVTSYSVYDTNYIVTDVLSNEVYIKKTDTNLISYFEIPLLFGYSFETGNWRFTMQTGPSLGIYRYAIGSIIASDLGTGQIESVMSITSVYTFTKISYNWLLTPSVAYAVNEHLSLQLQPRMRFTMNNVVQNDGIKLRYQSYGLHAGIVYRF
jgi:hypothetical protein